MQFEESRHDPGIRIVLECIPLRSVIEQIETALRRIIAPIPAKPACADRHHRAATYRHPTRSPIVGPGQTRRGETVTASLSGRQAEKRVQSRYSTDI